MAVYNGSAYLKSQLNSILEQLGTSDEVVIIDDSSTDRSMDLLRNFCDSRVRVYRNLYNEGVLKTFEKAIRRANGEIIFLSDQDDLWLPGKIERIRKAFLHNPNITLVASDAVVINENGSIIAESFLKQRGQFSKGLIHNLYKNKYLGCTLAFRRSMLEYFLPIPEKVPMHDIWFGLVNSIYGETLYIDQPLIAYRRHAHNLSPSEGSSVRQKIVWRWHLVKNLLIHAFHHIHLNRLS